MQKNCLKILILMMLFSCEIDQKEKPTFRLMPAEEIGVSFINELSFDKEFNVYTYRNFYNGGGVSIGDVNNDGLADIYLTANLKSNKLFLNKGDWKFEDVTEQAGVGGQKAWSTGVTMADVNGDGFLDIYVCNSGDVKGDNKQNELFINKGDLTFTESAEAYGLADKGYSTHASFFDYDKDGDLDAYILNNSYQAIGSFDLRRNERPKRDSLGGDKLLRNDEGMFVDVSEEAGIYGSIIGFGLGVTVGDVNRDGWDDIYVSNDFFERDYLYLNTQNGGFEEVLTEQMNSISGASMGADLADVNNDGYNDLFVTEMLPSDYKRLKSVTTFEDWNRYNYSLENGYYHQFTRNTFQVNNGDGSFSELGRMAGVEASDWSWGALFFDMNNDGFKDLFVANGIYQDLTDQDYLQYISNEEVVKSIVSNNEVNYQKLVELIPSNPIPNQAYLNNGSLKFDEKTEELGLATPSFSNGSAYGDLDNDGDLDLVVNNVNMESFIYQNQSEEGNYIQFDLKGKAKNTNAVGAKITVRQGGVTYYVEQQPIRGFQSSVDPRPHLGLATAEPVQVTVTWPSGQVSTFDRLVANQSHTLKEADATAGSVDTKGDKRKLFQRVDAEIDYRHEENEFVDFHRDRLLYHMNSTEGPKMATADVDGDGYEDLYLAGAKGIAGRLLMGTADGGFKLGMTFEEEAISEDAESIFFDADEDGDQDLYVCSGGTEFSSSSSALADRLYINQGSGKFVLSKQLLPVSGAYVSSSTVSAADVDMDGDIDLFVGERLKPLNYGLPGSGYLLLNDGAGTFKTTEFPDLGMIRSSAFGDLDGDGDPDLVVTGEYMGILVFTNENGTLKSSKAQTDVLKGWWSALHLVDMDGDGDLDILAGNHGLNSRFRASEEQPIKLYIQDFDQNGSLDPVLVQTAPSGREFPFALRHNLIDQMKGLKKKFPNYESFKDASIDQIFSSESLSAASVLEVNTLESMLLLNDGNFSFSPRSLPDQAQVAPVFAILAHDFDADGDMDVLLGGNLYGTKPEVGRYDASYGAYLENQGPATFTTYPDGHGFKVRGEIRDIRVVGTEVMVARNSDELVLFNYSQK
ncbi:VCBS repeat-containing protein [Marinoscillum furvescens]|uniref:VCBS repeat protein n=1 Tax=Marinoscillum furvescens DSM 4134 TaxID=1122208 RepID=A0A3D9L7R8_MARFU|nr:VCBS repeat-containing protein [Marinoscillum furvescens]REE01563.1 VCBS repeat protein [Marinoscillum furvescens DSM 4134]